MTTYTTIPNSDIDQDSPVTQPLMTALRDNPIAITEGSSGAPRIANAAFNNSVLGAEKFQTGTTERDWVLARTAGASVGAVGTYAFLYFNGSFGVGVPSPGSTTSGSNLEYSDSNNNQGSSPSGTWRCMGDPASLGFNYNATLWLRIS